MSARYDQSVLQTQTGCKLIEIILELNTLCNKYHDLVKTDIVEDDDYKFLQKKIKVLKNDHHKALNCITGNKGKSYIKQRNYMRSEQRLERYKTPS